MYDHHFYVIGIIIIMKYDSFSGVLDTPVPINKMFSLIK